MFTVQMNTFSLINLVALSNNFLWIFPAGGQQTDCCAHPDAMELYTVVYQVIREHCTYNFPFLYDSSVLEQNI